MASNMQFASQIPSIFACCSIVQPRQSESKRPISASIPSKIQILPFELKLQILEHAPDVLFVKNLVIACPSFYPVLCANRYNLLFDVLRRSLDRETDVLALIVVGVLKLHGQRKERRAQVLEMWRQLGDEYCLVNRNRRSFLDSQPSLSDLILFCRFHCWVVEKSEVFRRMPSNPKNRWPRLENGQELYQWFYEIEIFAAAIGERDRNWLMASLAQSGWESHVFDSWHEYSYARMAEIATAIWPSRFSKGTPCRRRTRVMLQRFARITGRSYNEGWEWAGGLRIS